MRRALVLLLVLGGCGRKLHATDHYLSLEVSSVALYPGVGAP